MRPAPDALPPTQAGRPRGRRGESDQTRGPVAPQGRRRRSAARSDDAEPEKLRHQSGRTWKPPVSSFALSDEGKRVTTSGAMKSGRMGWRRCRPLQSGPGGQHGVPLPRSLCSSIVPAKTKARKKDRVVSMPKVSKALGVGLANRRASALSPLDHGRLRRARVGAAYFMRARTVAQPRRPHPLSNGLQRSPRCVAYYREPKGRSHRRRPPFVWHDPRGAKRREVACLENRRARPSGDIAAKSPRLSD